MTAIAREDEVEPGWRRSFLVEEVNPHGGKDVDVVKDCKKGFYHGRFGMAYEYPDRFVVYFPGKKPMCLMNLEAKGIKRC